MKEKIALPRNFVSHGNGDGGASIETMVELMRASSPTRLNINSAASALSPHYNISSWTKRKPSALDMLEQITGASKGKQIVMFLDYDGTLSPIVDDPDLAFISDEMRATLKKLALCFSTAIVSGRCRHKVYSFVRLAELYYAGSHGMDIKGPSKHKKGSKTLLFQAATEFLPIINKVYKALLDETNSIAGAKVENNKFCVSVHFRCVDENKWSELAQKVRYLLEAFPMLQLTQGRKVFEVRPIVKWDKGKALEFLLDNLGYMNRSDVLPIYIGDDKTDEDAFKVLREREQGIGILVSRFPKDTNASYSLKEPSEVMAFLQRLVEWKQRSLREQLWKQRQITDKLSVSFLYS